MWLNGTHYPWVDMNRRAPRFALCKAASRDGCKVVLTGDSADELFTGYQHHDRYYNDEYNKETIDNYASKQKWIPKQIFSKTDYKNNALWYDLVSTSEQNILTTDQTCGMWGMESRPVFLSQSFVRYMINIESGVKFKTHPDHHIGTYKYLLLVGNNKREADKIREEILLYSGKTITENLIFQTQPSSSTNPNPNQPTTKMTIKKM